MNPRTIAAASLLVLSSSVANAQSDHLHCFKIKDAAAKAVYSADLLPASSSFPNASGCTITVPARQLCIPAQKTNVTPAPPGFLAGDPAQKYLCYKVKCPKLEVDTSATDQFGTHAVAVKKSSLVCAPSPAVCGDTAGPGGIDIPCACGDTVVTDTVLVAGSDPVTAAPCSGNGLVLGAGVDLDLGGNGLVGSSAGIALSMTAGASASNGSVRQFATGVQVSGGSGQTNVSDVLVEDNASHGIVVEVVDALARVVFTGVEVRENGGHGVFARSAPGAANLDDVADRIELSQYGVVLGGFSPPEFSSVHGNALDGIHLGDAVQAADLAASVMNVGVYDNAGSGIVLQQESAPATDCGASAGQPGCSGVTIASNSIYDNGGPGVTLQSGFIIPFYVAGPVPIDLGLGFVENHVFHNAMAGAGCTVAQTSPQISVTGPVGLADTTCAAAAPGSECTELSDEDGLNHHCVTTATSCFVGWDLRGDLLEGCENGLRNAIFGYNISDASDTTVGIRAQGNSVVDASNNEWSSSTSSQNVTQGAGSFVLAELTCGTRGCPAIP